MAYCFASNVSLDDGGSESDGSEDTCSLAVNLREVSRNSPSPVVEIEYPYEGNKRQRVHLSSVSNLCRTVGDRAYSHSPMRSARERSSPTFTRFPTRQLPPPLKLRARRAHSRSSGQSSPQSAYSSSSFFSSRGSPTSSHSSPTSSHGSFSKFSSLYSDHSRGHHLPRIQVSSLLSDAKFLSYHLEVVQQPQKAAEFANYPLSRLPVTPPLIVRLSILDASGNPVIPEGELPFLIAHLSLYNETGEERADLGPYRGVLYGNLVSTIEKLEDLQGNRGLFFLFPDVSVQWRGRYQMGITLLRISGSSISPTGQMGLAQHGQGLAEARTRVFEVLPRHQYTAAPQTRLTQSFIRQGARMFTFVSPPHP